MFYIYMIRNQNGRIYIGVSQNPKRRLYHHNAKQGAQFTKRGNYQIVFLEKYETLPEARQREIKIKSWRREKKEMLIDRYQKGLPIKT